MWQEQYEAEMAALESTKVGTKLVKKGYISYKEWEAKRKNDKFRFKAVYDHKGKSGSANRKGYTWGNTTREQKVKEEGPAPGDYDINSKAVEGPQYSIKMKIPTKIEPTPGPGLYETIIKEEKGITIGTCLLYTSPSPRDQA